MLKFIFWSLLAVNAALFAYGQGYLGKFEGAEREPARLKSQVAPASMRLVDAARAEAKAAQAREAELAERAREEVAACTEIGNFEPDAARRFESQVASLGLAARMSRIDVPVTEANQFMVHLPPQGSREAAERRAADLKARGIANYYIIPDAPIRWGISLGVFKSEQAAQSLRASLARQGVRGVAVTARGPTVTRHAFQFRGLAAGELARVQEVRAGHAGTATRSCG